MRLSMAMCLWACSSMAMAQQDLIVVRSMSAVTGVTGSTLTYDIAYKNGGPGAANGAAFAEQLPSGFQVLNVSCVGAFGGAVCPSTTIANNTLPFTSPRITGSIATFPEFAVVRLRVQVKLSATPGSYLLSGTITGPAADPIAGTNEVLSSLYVRPLVTDLSTSYSSTLPAIGGSNGLGGNTNVTFDGDTINSSMPVSVSYRIDNHGPDAMPGGAFVWYAGMDGFADWVSTNWTQATYGTPVGFESYRYTDPNGGASWVSYDDAHITPYTCTAIGSAVCPAATLYRVGGGWLSRAPTVTSRTVIGNTVPDYFYDDPYTKEVAPADIQEARRNQTPLFGQDLAPGAGLILTATLASARYGQYMLWSYDPTSGRYWPVFAQREGMFTQTDQLKTTRCQATADRNEAVPLYASISYSDPNTGAPLASVDDSDLANNSVYGRVGVTRNCPQADLLVTARATVNGLPGSVVTDGQDYAMTYTVTNNGPSNLLNGVQFDSSVYLYPGPGDMGRTFFSTNWNGFTQSISCTSSSTASPCPSQDALNAWKASGGTATFASPLASGAAWTIVVSGNAGNTTCTPGTNYYSSSWQGNLRAWGLTTADPTEGNNYDSGSDRFLTFAPQNYCGPTYASPRFALSANKSAESADSWATAVNVGDYVYFNVTLRNTSTEGITLRNAEFRDRIDEMRYQPNGNSASTDGVSSGPFQRQAGQPAGLDITVTAYNPANGQPESFTFPSGIVCTPHGAAKCPTSLTGYSSSYATAQGGSYSQVEAIIPLLPPAVSDYLELRMPWRAEQDVVGCVNSPYEGRSNRNYAAAVISETSAAVFPDGSEVLAYTLPYSASGGFATVYNKLTPCPAGSPGGTVQKTLRGHGVGTTSGNGTEYEAPVSNGETLTYDVKLTSTGTVGVNFYSFRDSKAIFMCRDGNQSNPWGVAGEARCGEVTLTGLSCTATGNATCPSQADLDTARSQSNAYPGSQIAVSGGSVENYASPVIPVDDTLTFTTTYTVSGVNSFTASVSNRASYYGQSGSKSFYPPNSETLLTLPYAPGMAMSKDVDKLQAVAGETITYTIDVTNGGIGSLAAGASFVDPLPAGLTAFSSVSCIGMPGPAASPNNGSGVCPAVITNNASGVSATLPEMLPNTMLRFVIKAIAPSGGTITSVGNLARVIVPTGASQATLRASANFAVPSAREAALAPAMAGFKSVRNATRAGTDSVLPNEQLVYTISYANTGGMDIDAFQIVEALPSYVTYSGGASVSTVGPITAGSINPAYNGTTVTQLLAPGAVLAGAGTMTISLPVTVKADTPAGTTISNQARASGSGVTGTVPTDNVDNTNPACPQATPAPCLPAGVGVPAGSVPQYQNASDDPVLVGVGARASNPNPNPDTPKAPRAIPASSPAQLVLLSLLVMGMWGVAHRRASRHGG